MSSDEIRITGRTSRQVLDLAKMSAAQRADVKRDSRRVFSILLFCVFFVALLAALVIGVNVYTHATETQNEMNTRREGIQLISNIVRANDANDVIGVGEGPEGRSLVMIEHLTSGDYETRLYLYQGNVVQEYSLASDPYDPARASVVTASSRFDFSYEKGLLTIYTDQGEAEVALRYAQGSN